VSLQWGDWDDPTRAAAWSMHCGELLRDALARPLSADERRSIADAALRRLLAIEPALPFAFIRDLPPERKLDLVESMSTGLDGLFDGALEELRRAIERPG
jgi:hypothetical protein